MKSKTIKNWKPKHNYVPTAFKQYVDLPKYGEVLKFLTKHMSVVADLVIPFTFYGITAVVHSLLGNLSIMNKELFRVEITNTNKRIKKILYKVM